MPRRGGITGWLQETTGLDVQPYGRVDELEESVTDARSQSRLLQKELDALGHTVLDYFGGREQDLTPEARRNVVQKSRVVWQKDPMAGASVRLMNEFTFGRGVPKPKARDEEVQKVLDEAWDDPANQEILTTHNAQVRLGTDLSLQSNIFFLIFDDGQDGAVKLSLLEHDTVDSIVKDPDNRFRHLWYVARYRRQEWDMDNDMPKTDWRGVADDKGKQKVLYYEHWRNFQAAKEEAEKLPGTESPPEPPPEKKGEGRVYPLSINRTTEMAFGYPEFERSLRWFAAYNKFMEARVDVMTASAAFVMKRKIKGTPNQVAKMASKAISRRPLAADVATTGAAGVPPKPGSVVTENEDVQWEDFNINTNAGNASMDASQLRSQVSAGTGFPPPYYGDLSAGSLATMTALELPVLKAVESRQEAFEQVFRWFIDRVIERAVETGRLSASVEAEPVEDPTELVAAHEDANEDEEATQRDLSYEFTMPNPLKRAMGDLVGAIMNIARTFDPNNTNPELSRTLLTVALQDGLEMQDASHVVEEVFPEGYVDPAVQAAQQAATAEGGGGFGEFGPQPNGQPNGEPVGSAKNAPGPSAGPRDTRALGADGRRHGQANAYGAPMRARPPERAMEALQGRAWWPKGRDGHPLSLEEVSASVPENRAQAVRRAEDELDAEVEQVLTRVAGGERRNGGSG